MIPNGTGAVLIHGAPVFSPDGEYFFSVSARQGDHGLNPYWVDADIVEESRAV